MKKTVIFSLLLFFSTSLQADRELVGGPCEGCEAVFEYGDRELEPVARLPRFAESESPLKVTGTIYEANGQTPAEGVILYIHQTNEEGIYPKRGDETGWGRRHGYLRGWIKTGPDGRYTFYTVKPGTYLQQGTAVIVMLTFLPAGADP